MTCETLGGPGVESRRFVFLANTVVQSWISAICSNNDLSKSWVKTSVLYWYFFNTGISQLN